MHKHNDPGYSRSDVYIIDDWREPNELALQWQNSRG